MNTRKTKLMVINGTGADREPLQTIESTSHYVYLGAHFTEDGRMSSVMKKHADLSSKQVLKFSAFAHKNRNMPYNFKYRTLQAALFSSMLYSCETWVTGNLASISKHYLAAVKALLGVRSSTPNTLCLVEAGLPEVAATILARRKTFMRKFTEKMTGDEPLACALCLGEETEMGRLLREAQNTDGDPEELSRQRLQTQCRERAATSTRFATYLNRTLTVHAVYTQRHAVPDSMRVDLSRLRLSSHRLRVETGRWARIPREERICSCELAELQDEEHVILRCPKTRGIRESVTYDSVETFFNLELDELCAVSQKLLSESVYR